MTMCRYSARRFFSPVAISIALISAIPFASAQEQTPAFGNDPRIAASSLDINVFASGLNFPMGMVVLPDRSLLVATSVPDGGSFFQSSGELIRLTDSDGDGHADDAGTPLASGLPGALVALQRIDDLVLVTSSESGQESITILRRGEHWRDPLVVAATLDLTFSNALHQSYGLVVRRNPDESKSYDVVFNIGAHGNVDAGVPVLLSGLLSAELDDASLYMMTIHDDGSTITADAPVQLAKGLRNASALAFDSRTGDLIIGENGMDTPGNDIVSLSADEIDVIPADKIGTEVFDFGFPNTYVNYQTGEIVGSEGMNPVIDFRPIDGSESEGIASFSAMPAGFPPELSGGYVAGFHGQFDSFGDENEENPLVYVDLATGDRFDLIANDNLELGHLDSLFASEDVLYIADICAAGSLVEAAPCGVIYQIAAGT
jgi:hypothetical protein